MVVPGIFEKDFEQVKKKLTQIQEVSELVQVDIADGVLVNGSTFLDVSLLGKLDITTKIELHLMVSNPLRYVEEKIRHVVQIYTQVEANHIDEFIKKAKSHGYIVGLSIAPNTPIEKLDPFLDRIAMVQFMTVVPGGQGRPLQYSALDRMAEFKKAHPEMLVQADGGFNALTAEDFAKTGVDNVEAGSAVFNTDNPAETYKALNAAFEKFKLKKHD